MNLTLISKINRNYKEIKEGGYNSWTSHVLFRKNKRNSGEYVSYTRKLHG